MDLCIRSQNKTKLLKVDKLEVKTTPGGHCIFAYSGNKEYCIGNYKTFDRMIEILDEIEIIKFYKYLANLDIKSFANVLDNNCSKEKQADILLKMSVYQMPKE